MFFDSTNSKQIPQLVSEISIVNQLEQKLARKTNVENKNKLLTIVCGIQEQILNHYLKKIPGFTFSENKEKFNDLIETAILICQSVI